MYNKKSKYIIFIIFLFIFAQYSYLYGKDITGIWYSEADKENLVSVIEVFKENGKYYAYAFNYKNLNAKEKNDIKNPNPSLRGKSLKGLIFVYNLELKNNEYINGKIYNPENGKTFNLKGELIGNILELRASADTKGIFGITMKWTMAENDNTYKTLDRKELRFPF